MLPSVNLVLFLLRIRVERYLKAEQTKSPARGTGEPSSRAAITGYQTHSGGADTGLHNHAGWM